MRIVHIAYSTGGGAGIAAYRLHLGLLNIGVDSTLITLIQSKDKKQTITYPTFKPSIFARILNKLGLPITASHKKERILKKHRSKNYEIYSFPYSDYKHLHEFDVVRNASIINFHWVSGFIDHQSFLKNIDNKIVWTLHDMNPFLSGFHYKSDHLKYSKSMATIESRSYRYKKKSLQDLKLRIVSPSKWLLNESKSSELFGNFDHTLIPNGLPDEIFCHRDQYLCRQLLSLDTNKITFLIIAESLNNYRKGFDLLIQALNMIENPDFQVISIGSRNTHLDKFTFVKQLGYIYEERLLAVVYNAADSTIIPSREDNLPNVLIESLCCGTPVIGFQIGGLNDAVENNLNGVLAKEMSASGLKKAIEIFLAGSVQQKKSMISENALKKYNLSKQAMTYKKLYERML